MTKWFWPTVYLVIFLVPFVIILAGCSTVEYDCRTWRQDDPANQAKRDYCFPDCPSCGPAFRGPYDG